MVTEVRLPKWLDDYIFGELKAKYCRCHSDMTVIDWDKEDVLNYLGTYFPRSYAESYCICSCYFDCNREVWNDKNTISVFDFGCGTGGEIIGLLDAIREQRPNIKSIKVTCFDGNKHELRLLENVIEKYVEVHGLEVTCRVIPYEVEDFYDLDILCRLIDNSYDLIMSFKAVCEFVTKERFEKENAYEYLIKTFLPKLGEEGLMIIADVTSYNNTSEQWLPMMLDSALESIPCEVLERNTNYNQIFEVKHSRQLHDRSKIAWRLIKNVEL